MVPTVPPLPALLELENRPGNKNISIRQLEATAALTTGSFDAAHRQRIPERRNLAGVTDVPFRDSKWKRIAVRA
jgi:hypothetical protein